APFLWTVRKIGAGDADYLCHGPHREPSFSGDGGSRSCFFYPAACSRASLSEGLKAPSAAAGLWLTNGSCIRLRPEQSPLPASSCPGADEVRELDSAKSDNQKLARPLPHCRPPSGCLAPPADAR